MNIGVTFSGCLFALVGLCGCAADLEDFGVAPPLSPIGEELGHAASQPTIAGVEGLTEPAKSWVPPAEEPKKVWWLLSVKFSALVALLAKTPLT